MKKVKTQAKARTNKNYETVLLEDMNSQFKAFGEGLGIVSDKIDKLEHGVEKLDKRVDNLGIGQQVLFGKVDKVESELNKVNSRLNKVENKLDNVANDVTEIKHKLSQKVDLEDFQKLEKRVIKLERLIPSAA